MARVSLVICSAVLAVACATGGLVRQRGDDDCVVAALAMLLRQPYDRVLTTFLTHDISIPTWTKDAIKVAAIYGVTLQMRRDLPKVGTGLLAVGFCDGGNAHMVYLERGEIYDPLGGVWGIDAYFTRHCADVVVFLEKN